MGVLEDEPRGEGLGLEAQLTDGAVGAGIARAGAVTLVAVKAEADTDTLVLAWIVTTGVHCGEKQRSETTPGRPLIGTRSRESSHSSLLTYWTPVFPKGPLCPHSYDQKAPGPSVSRPCSGFPVFPTSGHQGKSPPPSLLSPKWGRRRVQAPGCDIKG